MLSERQGERLPGWLNAVRQDDLPSLHSLAAGMTRDLDAVIAGLTLTWNSGAVEGHVNRIIMWNLICQDHWQCRRLLARSWREGGRGPGQQRHAGCQSDRCPPVHAVSGSSTR